MGTVLKANRGGDHRAPVSPLRHVLRIAQPRHQHGPGSGDALHAPAGLGGLAGKAVAGKCRAHQVEGVLRNAAMRGGVGQRLDHLEELGDRPRPAVAHHQRQRIGMLRAHVEEVDVDAVDARHVLREAVQPRFAAAPVVALGPVAAQLLGVGQGHALRPIRHRLLVRPARGTQPSLQIGQLLVAGGNAEGNHGSMLAHAAHCAISCRRANRGDPQPLRRVCRHCQGRSALPASDAN
jgi:hypothetical protein